MEQALIAWYTMENVCITVDTGICGFPCQVKAWKKERRIAGLEISGCDCKMIQKFAAELNELSINDLFLPLTRNPVFIHAERAACHPSCPVPVAVAKAAEVALGLALPKKVTIRFEVDCD